MIRLSGLFKNRLFNTVVGLVALAVLVWFVGPLIAIAGKVPLKSETVRLLVILALVLLWALNNVRLQMRLGKVNRVFARDMAAIAAPPDPVQVQSTEELDVLKGRFDDALQLLRKTLGKSGGQGIYALPWYIIIGPPGSGKTTALLNSGLNFPLAEKFGKEALRGVGGTRNCDWWFTDEAVLIDTAGRYTTQDSHREVDSAAWRGFLQLLKKHRRRQPVNGAIIAVSAEDLLTHTETERAQQIRLIRLRLQELYQQFDVQFPVYLMLTKCDLIAGFTDFYDDLGQHERQQIWGFTLPFDNESPAVSMETMLREFDLLLARLNQRLLWRMHQERDPQRKARIFSFPQQVASLRSPLAALLEGIFVSTRYDQPVLLRGVYFTSGTQEGSPIDRVMGAVARTFGVGAQALIPQAVQGRSYFLTRLLKDVIVGEAGLVGASRRFERQRIWLQRAAYGGAAGVTLLCILAWTTSFARNEVYIFRYKKALDQFAESQDMTSNQQMQFSQILARLNGIRNVIDVYQAPFYSGVPLLMRMGLYQGDRLVNPMEELYQQELQRLLLVAVKGRLELHLKLNAEDQDLQYEALKAYLMLADRRRRDPELLQLWMQYDWQTMFAADPQAQGQLQQHFGRLLDAGFDPVSLDPEIVQSARHNLTTAPLAELMYERLKRDYARADRNPLRLADVVGSAGARVLAGDGDGLNRQISSLFTQPGYHDFFKEQVQEIATLASEESWILSPDRAAFTDPELKALRENMQQLYFADYVRVWEDFLGGVRIVPFQNLTQATDVLNTLSAPGSPLRNLLNVAAENTQLARAGLLDKAAGRLALNDAQGRLSRVFSAAGVSDDLIKKPEQQVDDHFSRLIELVSQGESGSAPVDNVYALIGQLYSHLDAMASGLGVDPLTVAKGSGAADIVTRLQTEAGRLPEPVAGWLKTLALNSRQVTFSSARAQINQQWQSEIQPVCERALSGRYPFDRRSDREVALLDFARLLGPGGLIDTFFNSNIKPFVQLSNGRWQWKSFGDVSIGIPDTALTEFQRAARIRELFFPSGGSNPSVKFGLKPVYLDANVKRFNLDIEGQQFGYRHGPARILRGEWPAPSSTSQVRIEFEDDSGARLATTFDGPWAWFRLLDKAQVEARSRDVALVTFQERGRKSTWELHAETVSNPFIDNRIGQFRCPSSL